MGLLGIGNRCLSLCSNAFSDEVRFHESPSRIKLNLATTCPNLSVFSPIGDALDRVGLARSLQQGSVRHLALTADG